jgi:hypothetical protein
MPGKCPERIDLQWWVVRIASILATRITSFSTIKITSISVIRIASTLATRITSFSTLKTITFSAIRIINILVIRTYNISKA